jgi:hypothetical protein
VAGRPGGPEVGAGVCHHVAMSDDDLWRPKDPADPGDDQPADETSEAASGSSDLDMTQPITGGSGSRPSSDTPPPPPPAPPGPSYDAPPGPGAVPPPTNPYGQQPGPYASPYGGQQQPPPPTTPYPRAPQQPYGGPQNPYQPPQNPYPQPQEYGSPQNPYGVPYQPAYAGGMQPDHPSATTAMVLGIIGLVGLLLCGGLTLLLSPFAWATGAKSVREIDSQPGRYGGRDKAQAGKWMGIIGTILLILGVVLIIGLIAIGVAVDSSDSSPIDNGGTFQNG